MRSRHLTLLACVLGAGCGAAPQHSVQTPSQLEPPRDQRWVDLEQHDLALDAIMLGVPDCAEACEHLSALCALAEEICGLSRTAPAEVSEGQCVDANGRCERATTRVAAQCECSSAEPADPKP